MFKIPTEYQQNTNRIPTEYQEHTSRVPREYQQQRRPDQPGRRRAGTAGPVGAPLLLVSFGTLLVWYSVSILLVFG